jgi:hypothetical protein
VNGATRNMDVQVSLLYADFIFFEYMLKSGVAESYGILFLSSFLEQSSGMVRRLKQKFRIIPSNQQPLMKIVVTS